jgi:hypothetical protein
MTKQRDLTTITVELAAALKVESTNVVKIGQLLIASAMPLSHFQLFIVEEIAAHHDRRCRGGASRISIEAIALDCGSSPRRARTAIARLVDLGLIAIEHGLGTRGCVYHLSLPAHRMIRAARAVPAEPAPPA